MDPSEAFAFAPTSLGSGVVALMANPPLCDNGGLVFGDHASLVVDAGITPAVAHCIQRIVREQTSSPVRYLVNTTYRSDHAFGNAAFPQDVHVVSSRANAASMSDGRRPDITFDRSMQLDLGGIRVELWHFGPGNGRGDTIVYVPSTRTAWTGSFLGHRGIAPMLLDGGPIPYAESLRRMRRTLDVETVVPGQGPPDEGGPAIDWLIRYMERLEEEVEAGCRFGLSLEQLLATRRLPTPPGLRRLHLDTDLGFLARNRGVDRINVLATYRAQRLDGAM